MKKIILIVATVILIFATNLSFAYDWPFDHVSGPHTISGTLGEFRTNHLHAGVDVNPTSGLVL